MGNSQYFGDKKVIVGLLVLVVIFIVFFLFADRNNENSTQDYVSPDEFSLKTSGNESISDQVAAVGSVRSDSNFSGEVLSGATSASPVLEFNQDDYDSAKKNGKLIVIYFIGSGDNASRKEITEAFYPAMSVLDNPSVIGFVANFGKNASQSETEVARLYGVSLSKTKIVLKDGERLFKSFQNWNKDRYIKELNTIFEKYL